MEDDLVAHRTSEASSGAQCTNHCKGVARRGHGGHAPQFVLDKNKDLGNYDKYLPLRDCLLAGLLISGLTKKKYNRPATCFLRGPKL